jgi:integrase/recombinase XerD
MQIKNYKTEYLRYCRIEKENCLDTVTKYQDALNKIIATVGDIKVVNINQNTILELKERMLEQGLSDSRRALVISVLKSFLAYLTNFVGLQVYDFTKIKIPKVRQRPVQTLTVEEIDCFFGQLSETTLKDKRFKALVSLLSACGARIAEILGLRRNTNIFSKEAVVLGKCGVYRTIYWDDRAVNYLKLYQDARPEWDKSEFLFGTVNKSESYSGKWDKGDVNRSFRKWSKKVGRRLHCHLFRSSYCTNALKLGMPVASVSKLLGHYGNEAVRTTLTNYYCPMSDMEAREVYRKFEKREMVNARADIKDAKGGEKL